MASGYYNRFDERELSTLLWLRELDNALLWWWEELDLENEEQFSMLVVVVGVVWGFVNDIVFYNSFILWLNTNIFYSTNFLYLISHAITLSFTNSFN